MILNHFTPDAIAGNFSRETLARALAYARDGSTSTPEIRELTHDVVDAVTLVHGSRDHAYVVHLRAALRGDHLSMVTSCSCPVARQCKHGAALVMVLGSSFRSAPRVATWESGLAGLVDLLGDFAPPDHDLPGVALAVTYTPAGRHHHYYPSGPKVTLRPMRPGARQAWVRSGLDWSGVTGPDVRRSYQPEQVDVLIEMADVLSSRGGFRHAGDDPALGDFGPTVLALLLRAQDAGITLLPTPPLAQVDLLADPLEMVVDASSDADGTSLSPGLLHDGRLWRGDDVILWGDPAHSVGLLSGATLSLGCLTRRLPSGPARALRSGESVKIPVDEPVPDHLRRLMRLVPVISRDSTVLLPEPVRPRLRLTVAWASSQVARLTWHWVYEETVVDADRPHEVRDRDAERQLIGRLPQPPDLSRTDVSGVDVLHLALLELPVWRSCEDVEVVEVDAPRFREADEGPEVEFVLAETEDSGPTDWLDLEILLSVEGEPVALADALAALTLGHEFLVLPSGLFVRTDRPEFEKLHDVVRAAGELRERDGNRVSVGRHDLGLWAQLAELGIVDAQAAEWVRRARALRDLVDLPRPDPTGVVSTLRSYQLDGFHWLVFLWEHRLGGILADDMGLGKTLQVLSLIAHTRSSTDAPFLVVAPTSVVSAWLSEAARHTPGLRIRAVTGTGSRREESIAEIAAQADVVVTSYTLLRLDRDDYADVTWAGLVLDEAQQVKNHQSKAYTAVRMIEAPFRLAVTGTPFENRLLELWSLLSIATPGLYPHPRSFIDSVVGPVEKRGDAAALRRFRLRIKPFMLRRTKELVAADLPPKQEQVSYVELGAKHRKLYDAHLAKERQRILGLVDDFDHNRVAILAALTTLRQLALDPALVDPAHDTVGSAKLDALVEHLVEITAEGHRALVFSTFTGFLKRVRTRLEAEGVTTAYLDGATRQRGSVIDEFRSGDASAFLISLKAGGVGLTLTEADYVFVLDPWWNPAAEAQAVDRTHRIGQDKTVMVYRMISSDTIEDKVMALKERKADLFRRVIDGDTAASASITADDIRALFD